MDTITFSQANQENTRKKIAALVTKKSLELIILPTEQCNFRCTYCYEDFSIGRMSEEISSSIKMLLDKRCQDLSLLKISWFGGEPLLAKDIILDISRHSMQLVENYPNIRYLSNMTTNGYLLDINTANVLVNSGVCQYQISLDGPREIHDKSRLRADGKSTFDKIWNNLLAIRDSHLDLNVNLRIHFTADTFQMLDPLIEDLKENFSPDRRFSFYFKAIEQLGGVNDKSIKMLSENDKVEVVKSLESKLFSDHLDLSQKAAFGDDYICYASKPNSLVIRANGTVGKCTVALSDERNSIGSIQPNGTFKLIPSRFAPWIRGIETLDPETLGCPLVGLPTSEDITASLQEKNL